MNKKISELDPIASPSDEASIPIVDGGTKRITASNLRAYVSANFVAKGELVFNVKDYGAVGDGVANDTPAIQSAINAANAAGGGVVYVPKGTYRQNMFLRPYSNVSIRGAGMGKTIFLPYNTDCIVDITNFTAENPMHDVVFSDFTIDGSNQTGVYPAGWYKGIFILYLERCVFRDLHIYKTGATGLGCDYYSQCVIDSVVAEECGNNNPGDQPGGAGIGIGVAALSPTIEPLIVTNCHALNNKRFGIFIETQNSDLPGGNVIANNVCVGNGDAGIGLCGGRGTICTGNVCYGNDVNGILVNTGSYGPGKPDQDCLISNNVCHGNGADGIAIAAATGEVLSHIAVRGNKVFSNSGSGVTCATTNTIVSNLVITSNDIHSNGAAGVHLTYTGAGQKYDGLDVSNNIIYSNGKTHTTINAGIELNQTVSYGRISGNKFYDSQGTRTQSYAIRVHPDSNFTLYNVAIVDNDIRLQTTGSIYLRATSTYTQVSVARNVGYNPYGISDITVGASPFTYTAGVRPEVIYVKGGTVSSVVKSGYEIATATNCQIPLAPNQSLTVTYSAAPAMRAEGV